ncbi:hypothetical protein RMCBS344292_00120 [Rhizopus microsporus]|nr:hypothetical protein RMCBS344292_00120 [Rhizopus microsporus]
MEDMYQYAAAATTDTAGSNSNNEENDVILKAFHNMGWGKKWSSLVDTVKKQHLLKVPKETCKNLPKCLLKMVKKKSKKITVWNLFEKVWRVSTRLISPV